MKALDPTAPPALGGLGRAVLVRRAREVDHLHAAGLKLDGPTVCRHSADGGETLGGEQGLLGLAPLGVVDAKESDLAHRPDESRIGLAVRLNSRCRPDASTSDRVYLAGSVCSPASHCRYTSISKRSRQSR